MERRPRHQGGLLHWDRGAKWAMSFKVGPWRGILTVVGGLWLDVLNNMEWWMQLHILMQKHIWGKDKIVLPDHEGATSRFLKSATSRFGQIHHAVAVERFSFDRLQHFIKLDVCSGYGTMQKATCHRFLTLMDVDTHCKHASVRSPPVSWLLPFSP